MMNWDETVAASFACAKLYKRLLIKRVDPSLLMMECWNRRLMIEISYWGNLRKIKGWRVCYEKVKGGEWWWWEGATVCVCLSPLFVGSVYYLLTTPSRFPISHSSFFFFVSFQRQVKNTKIYNGDGFNHVVGRASMHMLPCYCFSFLLQT